MIYVNAVSLVNALGANPQEILENLAKDRAPGLLTTTTWAHQKDSVVLASVKEDLPKLDADKEAIFNSRNNRLLALALQHIEPQIASTLHGVDPRRVAVVMGTSTSGSQETVEFIKAKIQGDEEQASRFVSELQEMGDPSRFLAHRLHSQGPQYTICTACTSSARSIMSGARLIEAGLVDVAIVGGVDTLSEMPINGFDALGVLSERSCVPMSQSRQGITIGEAAGLMILSRQKTENAVSLLGWGESSDGYHMSSPDPNGQGAELAIRAALDKAQLAPEAIDYINMHGTGTPLNDSAESQAIYRIFGSHPWVSSTKTLTGHTLGAAGITDAGLLVMMLMAQGAQLPGQFKAGQTVDPALPPLKIVTEPTWIAPGIFMTNNFAFGGNNTSLIFGVSHE